MKTITLLTTLLASASLVNAQCCDKGTSRISTLTGTAEEATSCEAAPDITENTVYLAVDGMSCGKCSGKISKALTAVDGVTVQKVCHKSGSAKVLIDPEKTNPTAVAKTITDSGFKVVGDIVHMDVEGMTCSACSTKLTKALEKIEGVSVKKVCHKSGCTDVVINDKASKKQVAKAVADSGFKVKEG